MQDIYLDHPTEEALERFILHHADEAELEVVETHILACESCVTRLEDMELQIAATKLALQQVRNEQLAKEATKKTASWKNWAMAPGLSLAGGLAVLAVGVILAPQFIQKRSAEVALSAYRGLESSTVPEGRPLHISLNANDLSSGPVAVELVNESGRKLWQGLSTVEGDKVEVSVPRISEPGTHFLRLYASKSGQTEGDLLREFAFQVK